MYSGIIAIPTREAASLQGKRSDHFGHSEYFTLVDLELGQPREVHAVANTVHAAGGCQQVVRLLQERRVEMVIAAGMGKGPFTKLGAAGIQVLFADQHRYPDVRSVIDALPALLQNPFAEQHLCKGSGACHAHDGVEPLQKD